MADTSHLSPAVRELAEAIRLTREYVGEDLLPAVEGWSWYDALRRWAPEHLPRTEPITIAGRGVTTPCPKWSLEQAHDAHDWNAPVDGPSHCPGYDATDEGQPEPASPRTLAEQVRDLERTIERVREAVGTDAVLVSCEEHAARIETLGSALRGVLAMFEKQIEQRILMGALGVNTVRRWHAALDGHVQQTESGCAGESELAEARSWARHGYEIGQRHCGWSGHGVAPAWLTEGWPLNVGVCKHVTQAAEYDTALSRVRGLPETPEVMDAAHSDPSGYLHSYKVAIGDAKQAARIGQKGRPA